MAEKRPDFCENPEEPCAQLDWTIEKHETLENSSRRWRTLFEL
jgi:hypothetical protein